MGYRQRPDFMTPSAEDLEHQRKVLWWLIPLMFVQQGVTIFRADADALMQVSALVIWAAISLVILALLLGLKFRWMSERDHRYLNDEWHREISGDAARWAFAAVVTLGIGLMVARLWLPLDMGKAVYGLVNAAVIVAVARHAWLNRSGPDEDE